MKKFEVAGGRAGSPLRFSQVPVLKKNLRVGAQFSVIRSVQMHYADTGEQVYHRVRGKRTQQVLSRGVFEFPCPPKRKGRVRGYRVSCKDRCLLSHPARVKKLFRHTDNISRRRVLSKIVENEKRNPRHPSPFQILPFVACPRWTRMSVGEGFKIHKEEVLMKPLQ